MLADLLDALAVLAEMDLDEILDEAWPEELRELCKHKALIHLLLALCERRSS